MVSKGRAENMSRLEKALLMKVKGHTDGEICRRLGYPSSEAARKAIAEELARHVADARDELVALELARLDWLTRQNVAIAVAKHPALSGGHIVYYPDLDDQGKPVPVLDHGPNLTALRNLTDISQRRAKLEGLDAPTTLQMDLSISQLEAQLERAQLEYDRRAPDPQAPAAAELEAAPD